MAGVDPIPVPSPGTPPDAAGAPLGGSVPGGSAAASPEPGSPAPGLRLPPYTSGTLAELSASVLAALDVPGFPNPLGLEPARRVCLLVIDGLGWELLRSHPVEAPFLNALVAAGVPVSAGFPATTVASLGSIGTALPPARHGLIGYTILLPGEARALNCLRWSAYGIGPVADLRDRLRPELVQPAATVFQRAAADGVGVTLVGPREYATSGFTRAVLRGGRYEGVLSFGDLLAVATRTTLAARRTLVYAYHPDLDVTGHVRGTGTDAWRTELWHTDRLVEALAGRLPADALLVITGDHGMVDVDPAGRIDLADSPELAAGVRVLAGEPRARHVHTVRGATRDVLDAWRAVLGDAVLVLPGEEAVAAGWFGPAMPDPVRRRVGDLVTAAIGPVAISQREVDPGVARLIGQHGSMTPAEQLVPLLTVRGPAR